MHKLFEPKSRKCIRINDSLLSIKSQDRCKVTVGET